MNMQDNQNQKKRFGQGLLNVFKRKQEQTPLPEDQFEVVAEIADVDGDHDTAEKSLTTHAVDMMNMLMQDI